jgi:LysR family transcriptional activator of nhaA
VAVLNYNHLRYFRAVAHEGHLTRAAERLNLSQSALSAQIRRLEERLGHDLFERRGRGLVLTEAGRIALDHADAIFRSGDELVATLRGREGPGRRTLRVGALATLSRNFQIAFLRPLLPCADVELVLRSGGSGELLVALEGLALDVVLTNRAPAVDAASPIRAHRLDEQGASLVGLPGALPRGATLAARLAEAPLVLPGPGSGLRQGFDALASRLGVRPRVAAEVDDMAMMRLLAREGAGLAVLPPIVVRDELGSGLLAEVERLPGIAETFYALTVERRFPNPLLAPLLDAWRVRAGAPKRWAAEPEQPAPAPPADLARDSAQDPAQDPAEHPAAGPSAGDAPRPDRRHTGRAAPPRAARDSPRRPA